MPTTPRLAVGALVAALWASGLARPAGSPQEAPAPALTLRMIVVTSEAAAERVLGRLNAGESFAVVAAAESTAASASSGGWLGKLPLSELRPDVRRALDGVEVGHITPIIRLPTGFAIFKVEPDDPGGGQASRVGQALASSGTVRYVTDLSGFSEARAALDGLDKAPDWNLNPASICEARTRALATSTRAVETYLSSTSAAALAAAPPIDVMQLYFGLGQLAAYEGKMDIAVSRFAEAARIAAAGVPTAVLQMEEALGVAHLHKAGMDNGAFEAPGDYCLLGVPPSHGYPQTADVTHAIEHFTAYLDRKPDDLEVRWLLNMAYRTIGGYPSQVPVKYLIPPSTFQSAEDLGRFHDVASAAGLDIVSSAGGVLVDDFRGTGRFDVITSTMDSCGSMRMFGANGDGTYSDRTAAAGLEKELGGLNIVQGDYNNDGCPDILVLRGGWEYMPQRMSLLRNNCDGTFTDVTAESGLGEPITSQTAVWTDVDNDGFLDLFVGNETGPARLYHNSGHGTFQDIAASAGVNRFAFTKGVAAADYDNDRYPDLYVSNYGETNFLYHNNHDGTFTEFSAAARVQGTPTGFATWFFDYDNDGLTDLFVTSYVPSIDDMVRDDLHLPHNGTTMKLYRNQGDGTFRDVSEAAGLDRVLMPMGSNFGDIDNDGYLDMYLGTGQPSYAALQGAVLLHNQQGRRFVDVTASSGTGELHRGHGVAFADLDNDGDEDIVFVVGGATPGDRHATRLFENPGHGNDWIGVTLAGVKSNRSAVGARVTATVTDARGRTRKIYRTVGSGSSFGGTPLLQHLGLGPSARRVDLDIWWPTTDTRQHFGNVGKNRWVRIEEFATRPTKVDKRRLHLGGAGRKP